MEPPFPNVLKRSFLRAASMAHRQYVLQHRNGVCVLGLALDHPILSSPSIGSIKVTFPANMAVQRKRKRGKHSGTLKAWDTICSVQAGDTVFNIPACIGGQVLELNHRLEGSPELLLSRVSQPARGSLCCVCTLSPAAQPADEGFIAMVAPSFDIVLDSIEAAGSGGVATAAAEAAADDSSAVPSRPGRKQQLPLVGMTAYEEAAAKGSLPEFKAIDSSEK